jgi:hypothetical protein
VPWSHSTRSYLFRLISRLVAAGLLPERAGQPVKIWAHISSSGCAPSSTGAVGKTGPGPTPPQPGEALEQAIIGKAVDLLSGPGGLASVLRRRQLGARLGGPSLPLDIGYSETIPAGIRNAVILRDRHCQWAGRCDQPAVACQVHHTKHKADGGPTSVKDRTKVLHSHGPPPAPG